MRARAAIAGCLAVDVDARTVMQTIGRRRKRIRRIAMDCSRILAALAVGLSFAAQVLAQQRGETTPIPPSFPQPGPYFPAVPVVPVQTAPPTELTPLPGIPFPRAG